MELTIIMGTLLVELLTVFGRLFFGSNQERFRRRGGKVRIHHGYVGLTILLLGFFFYPLESVLILGWVLLLSDAVHHFVVLPVWVGKTEFP